MEAHKGKEPEDNRACLKKAGFPRVDDGRGRMSREGSSVPTEAAAAWNNGGRSDEAQGGVCTGRAWRCGPKSHFRLEYDVVLRT